MDPAVAKEIGAAGRGSNPRRRRRLGNRIVKLRKRGCAADRRRHDQGSALRRRADAPGLRHVRRQPVDGSDRFRGAGALRDDVRLRTESGGAADAGCGRRAAGRCRRVPFVLDGRQPQFACRIDGNRDRNARWTPGARDSITLHGAVHRGASASRARRSYRRRRKRFRFRRPVVREARARSARSGIGSFTLPQVVGDFTSQRKGRVRRYHSSPRISAAASGNASRVTLDYESKRWRWSRTESLDKPDVYERAGLFLLNRGGKYVVLDARPGTAAARPESSKATHRSIDGKPASRNEPPGGARTVFRSTRKRIADRRDR